jgi:hypothetical protein
MPIPKLHEAIIAEYKKENPSADNIRRILEDTSTHSPTMFSAPSPLLEEIHAGQTPLQYLATGSGPDKILKYHLEVTKLLIEKRAELDAVDSRGNTALHYAAIHGKVEIAEALVKAGADTTIKDYRTTIETASGFSFEHGSPGTGMTAADYICHIHNRDEPKTFPAFEAALRNPASADWDTAMIEQEQQKQTRKIKHKQREQRIAAYK